MFSGKACQQVRKSRFKCGFEQDIVLTMVC